jgi:WD40 repeat protein
MHGAAAFIRDVDVEVDGVVDGLELRGDGRRLAVESNGVVRLLDTDGDRVLLEAPGERATFVDGGRYLAAMTGPEEMSLWASDTGAAHRTLAIGRVSELATGGDVIFASVLGGIRAYSTRDGALLFERRADGEPLGGLSVSADGARLLVARSFLTIYDRGGEIIRRASSPGLDTVATIAPDGQRFAMSSNRGLAVVGVHGGDVEQVIRVVGVGQIFWSSSGDRIFASESRQVCVWRLAATSARVEGCWQGATGTRHVLPPSLERIAASRGSGAVELWDAGGRVRAVLPVARDGFARVDLSDAGDRVVTASSSGAVRLWRGDADNLHGAVDRPPGHELRYEGGRLAVAGDRELTVWDLDRPDRPLQRFESAGGGGNRVAISAGGSVAAWSGKTWDLDAGRAIAELASWTPGDSVAVSADGAHVITCGRGFCRGFDARGGRERWALELAGPLKMSDLPAVAITAGVSFAPTGEALLTGTGVDAIVDAASGAVRRTIGRETRSLAMSEAFLGDRRVAIADGRRIYIAALDGEGVETRTGVGLGLTAHPDGRRLLVPLTSGALLVDTRSGDQVRIDVSSEPTGGAAISPDGALVAIARGLGSIEIFDTATGRALARRGAGQFINLVHFSPEGRLVAVTSNGALVWALPTETRPPDEVRAAVAPLLE